MRVWRGLLPLLLLVAVATSGCLTGEARTEWAYEATQLDQVHQDGRTGAGVTVAVLDTGINLQHPSLRHLHDGDRSNGEVVAFKDYLEGDEGVENARDPDGHGSHVTGIISARGSDRSDKLLYNGVDLLGGAPDVRLVVARVCDSDSCDVNAIPQAVDWAVQRHRADVVSLSLGGQSVLPGAIDDLLEDRIERAINSAIDRGVVVIASAGNSGPDNEDVDSPSNIPGVIAVGAVDQDLRVAGISSRGDNPPCRSGGLLDGRTTGRCRPNEKPELVAPGVDILSAWTSDGYARATGTSQATPFVTSAVANMLQDHPELRGRSDVMEIKRALVDTARPLAQQSTPHDDAYGYGLLQAAAAHDAYR